MENRKYTIAFYAADGTPVEYHYESANKAGSQQNKEDCIAQYTRQRGRALASHLRSVINDAMTRIYLDDDRDTAGTAFQAESYPGAEILTAEEEAVIREYKANHYVGPMTDLSELKWIKEAHAISWNAFRNVIAKVKLEPATPDMITASEYAKLHGITPATMRQRIARGCHPEAVKIGRDWIIPRESAFTDSRTEKEERTVYSAIIAYGKLEAVYKTREEAIRFNGGSEEFAGKDTDLEYEPASRVVTGIDKIYQAVYGGKANKPSKSSFIKWIHDNAL